MWLAGLLELESSLPDFILQPRISAPHAKTVTREGFVKRKYRDEKILVEIHDVRSASPARHCLSMPHIYSSGYTQIECTVLIHIISAAPTVAPESSEEAGGEEAAALPASGRKAGTASAYSDRPAARLRIFSRPVPSRPVQAARLTPRIRPPLPARPPARLLSAPSDCYAMQSNHRRAG